MGQVPDLKNGQITSERMGRQPSPEIVHVITGLNNGGAEGALFRLCFHSDSPRSMVISLLDEGLYGEKLRASGVDVVCLNMPKGAISLKGLLQLLRTLRRANPKVVQTWMYHADLLGGIAARLVGIKRVCWGIRSTRLPRYGTARKVAHICSRLSKLIPHAIVCCAQSAALEHVRLGYNGDRMTVISNGFDFERLRPDPEKRQFFRTSLHIGPGEPLIGFVARFNPQKDHANLLRALRILNERGNCPTLVLVGPDMESNNSELQQLIAMNGLSSHVKPIGPYSDITAVMNGLDLHVMSSRSEGFPNVLAEAMACGCPCVSTNVGAAKLILGDTGWLVPPEDSEALAEALVQALALFGTEAWQHRRDSVRESAANRFGMAKMVADYRKVWQI